MARLKDLDVNRRGVTGLFCELFENKMQPFLHGDSQEMTSASDILNNRLWKQHKFHRLEKNEIGI